MASCAAHVECPLLDPHNRKHIHSKGAHQFIEMSPTRHHSYPEILQMSFKYPFGNQPEMHLGRKLHMEFVHYSQGFKPVGYLEIWEPMGTTSNNRTMTKNKTPKSKQHISNFKQTCSSKGLSFQRGVDPRSRSSHLDCKQTASAKNKSISSIIHGFRNVRGIVWCACWHLQEQISFTALRLIYLCATHIPI